MQISLKFVPNGPVNNVPSLVEMFGAKSLPEAMMP